MKASQQTTIPKNWQQAKLGDVCSIKTGKRDANHGNPNGQYPFFTCAKTVSKIEDFSFDTEAVLVAGNGDFNIKYYNGKFDAYQRTYILDRFTKNSAKFFFYKLEQVLQEITKNNQGSSVKFIKKGDLENYTFPLPPLPEQQKIAEILGSVDEEIEKVSEEIEKSEELKRGVEYDLIGGHSKLKKQKLKDSDIQIIDGDRGKNYPKLKDFSNDGYCLFLNTKNIQNDRFIFVDCKFISKEKNDALRKGKLKRYDVVLTTRGTVGNVAYFDENVPYDNIRINSGMLIFRAGKNYDTEFVYKYLSSYIMKSAYISMASGSAQPQLPIKSLNLIEIPILSINEQKEFAKILSTLDDKIELSKKLKHNLTKLKKGLMQDLLNGVVRVIT